MTSKIGTSSGPSVEKGKDGPLTGKPWFNMMISKSALPPKNLLVIPEKGRVILPEDNVKTKLTRGDKECNVIYNGIGAEKRFDIPGWTTFAKDNNLQVGDACIFEVMEIKGKKMTLKVSVLNGEFPLELLRDEGTKDDTIVIEDDTIVIEDNTIVLE